MYKNHPLLRLGNKWNDIKHFEDLLPSDVKTVVEPFAGSWAVIRHSYHEPKYKRHINDADKEFMMAQDWVMKNPVKTAMIYRNAPSSSNADIKHYLSHIQIPSYVKNEIMAKMTSGGHTKHYNPNDNDNIALSKVYNNTKKTSKDYTQILGQYVNNPNTFVFIDPPYLGSYNDSYNVDNENISEIYNNLYDFWGNDITNEINNDVNSDYLINLASVEYFKSVKKNFLKSKLINIIFKEKKNLDYKVIGIFSKKARGLMSRYIIKNKIKDPDKLKKFNLNRYRFNKKLSSDTNWVFTR